MKLLPALLLGAGAALPAVPVLMRSAREPSAPAALGLIEPGTVPNTISLLGYFRVEHAATSPDSEAAKGERARLNVYEKLQSEPKAHLIVVERYLKARPEQDAAAAFDDALQEPEDKSKAVKLHPKDKRKLRTWLQEFVKSHAEDLNEISATWTNVDESSFATARESFVEPEASLATMEQPPRTLNPELRKELDPEMAVARERLLLALSSAPSAAVQELLGMIRNKDDLRILTETASPWVKEFAQAHWKDVELVRNSWSQADEDALKADQKEDQEADQEDSADGSQLVQVSPHSAASALEVASEQQLPAPFSLGTSLEAEVDAGGAVHSHQQPSEGQARAELKDAVQKLAPAERDALKEYMMANPRPALASQPAYIQQFVRRYIDDVEVLVNHWTAADNAFMGVAAGQERPASLLQSGEVPLNLQEPLQDHCDHFSTAYERTRCTADRMTKCGHKANNKAKNWCFTVQRYNELWDAVKNECASYPADSADFAACGRSLGRQRFQMKLQLGILKSGETLEACEQNQDQEVVDNGEETA